MHQITNAQIIIRLTLSAALSSMIGFERELRRRAAGLRTHMLVGLSSCLLMLVSIYVAQSFGEEHVFDPGRIAAGVVTGIGLLCAGAIIRFGASVKGVTTAASLWAVAAIGLAIGSGFYIAACLTTVLILVTLLLVARFEKMINRDRHHFSLKQE